MWNAARLSDPMSALPVVAGDNKWEEGGNWGGGCRAEIETNELGSRTWKPPRFWLVFAWVVVVVVIMYTCSYVCLSLGGRYQPGDIGGNGVKHYLWAPNGFVTGYRWNLKLIRFYALPYMADRRLWHRDDDIFGGKYPVKYVDNRDAEEIEKIFRAYREANGTVPAQVSPPKAGNPAGGSSAPAGDVPPEPKGAEGAK
jgi:hypothetical protein